MDAAKLRVLQRKSPISILHVPEADTPVWSSVASAKPGYANLRQGCATNRQEGRSGHGFAGACLGRCQPGPQLPPVRLKCSNLVQAAGGRRQAAGGRRQAAAYLLQMPCANT